MGENDVVVSQDPMNPPERRAIQRDWLGHGLQIVGI